MLEKIDVKNVPENYCNAPINIFCQMEGGGGGSKLNGLSVGFLTPHFNPSMG